MRGHGFAAVAVFGGFSACLTWFQPFSAEVGTATASGFSLPRRRQSPFTTRLPEAPVRVLHSSKAKNSRDNGKFISRSVRYYREPFRYAGFSLKGLASFSSQ